MDFEFSPEQQAFAEEVEQFLDEHDDPEVFDLTRENMAQIVDTPKRRAFMRSLGYSVVLSRCGLEVCLPRVHAECDYSDPLHFDLQSSVVGRECAFRGPRVDAGLTPCWAADASSLPTSITMEADE